MIKELMGKEKGGEEEAYIYDELGEKREIMEVREEFVGRWRENIYQKAKKADFSFWYKKGGEKEKLEQAEKLPNSTVMKFPVIELEELVNTIKGMKNGKAAGIDGVRSELMKFLMGDKEILEYTLKCFNNILHEKVNTD